MKNKSPELKISVPLNRLKPITIEHIKKMKHIVKRKSLTSAEKDAHLLLNLSKTVSVVNTSEMEEPPIKKKKLEKLEDLEIIDLATEESDKEIDLEHQKEDSTIKPNLPISGPVESEKEDKSPNEKKETYAVSKEDYELLLLIKSKGITKNNLDSLTVSVPARPINSIETDINNNNNSIETNILSMEDNKFNLDDDISDKIISHSQENKTMIVNMMNFYQNKPKQVKTTKSISISAVIEEIVNKTNGYEDKITFMFDKETQTCSDSKEKSIEKSKEMHENYDDKKGIVSLEARQSINKMPAQGNESMMKMHQMPISPVPGALPNDQQLQKNQNYSANYPSMKMMSALEIPEHVQRMNKNWHTFYGAKGAGTESQQRHPTQKRAATASNAAFTPQHFPGSNNQVSMAAQQKRNSNNLTATATSNVAQPPAYFNTCFNAAFNNQELQAMQNMPVAGMPVPVTGMPVAAAGIPVAAAAMHGPAAASNFSMHQQCHSFDGPDEYAPAVMRNMAAAGAQYMPAAGSSGQMEMVYTAQQQCNGYQNPDTIRKRAKNTHTRFPQLSMSSPVEGTKLLTGQQRWRAIVSQQWQSPPPNYPSNNAWHQ